MFDFMMVMMIFNSIMTPKAKSVKPTMANMDNVMTHAKSRGVLEKTQNASENNINPKADIDIGYVKS